MQDALEIPNPCARRSLEASTEEMVMRINAKENFYVESKMTNFCFNVKIDFLAEEIQNK